jgi:hypothetical protein
LVERSVGAVGVVVLEVVLQLYPKVAWSVINRWSRHSRGQLPFPWVGFMIGRGVVGRGRLE